MLNITKELLIAKLDEGKTNEAIAAEFNCGVTTIKRRKVQFGLVGYKTNSKPLTITEMQHCTDLILDGATIKDCTTNTGITGYRLNKYLPPDVYALALDNYSMVRGDSIRNGDLSKLLHRSRETSYLIGYLQADGSVSSNGAISAVSIDKQLIESVQSIIGGNIGTYGNKYTISVADKKLLNEISEHTNLCPRKTYIEYNIPEWILSDREYLEYFIVGVFNGDGWVYQVRDGIVELGIQQHIAQRSYIQTISKILGWNYYEQSTKDSCSATTKKKSAVSEFAEIYTSNPYSLGRKATKIQSVMI